MAFQWEYKPFPYTINTTISMWENITINHNRFLCELIKHIITNNISITAMLDSTNRNVRKSVIKWVRRTVRFLRAIIFLSINLLVDAWIYVNLNPLIIVAIYRIYGSLNCVECSTSLLINDDSICNITPTTILGSTETKITTEKYD